MHTICKKEWNNPPEHFAHRCINGSIQAKNIEAEGWCNQPYLDNSHHHDAVPYQIKSQSINRRVDDRNGKDEDRPDIKEHPADDVKNDDCSKDNPPGNGQ